MQRKTLSLKLSSADAGETGRETALHSTARARDPAQDRLHLPLLFFWESDREVIIVAIAHYDIGIQSSPYEAKADVHQQIGESNFPR